MWEKDGFLLLLLFIYIIVMCIWKVCLFKNILILKIITPTKK